VTIFKKIIDKQIPAKIIYEDDDVLAFNDLNPQAPVHFLVIPKREIRSLADLQPGDEKILGVLIKKAAEIAASQGLAQDGYRLVINTNDNGGQSVYHLHAHVLGGRALTWPPG
jgi:histidine triad (HIT) family protein